VDHRFLPYRASNGLRITCLLALALLCVSCAKSVSSIPATHLIPVDDLAHALADSTAAHPVLLHVGFAPLYRSGHIPGSRYVGPGSKPDGIAALKQALGALPPDRAVVLYCGCCPWQDCPNVRPAYEAAMSSGHGNVRVLYITGNLERDWIAKGLPTVKVEE
jgi:hypothetical protein